MTNSQITDSVRLAQFFTVNSAPSQTQAMLSAVMAKTVGMGMYNAISAQQSAQMLSAAAITSTCARMLSVQTGMPPPPAPKPTPTPPPNPAPPAPTPPNPSPTPTPTPPSPSPTPTPPAPAPTPSPTPPDPAPVPPPTPSPEPTPSN